ncbi:MAG: DNA-3-methyladenine glycosylase 2 family protein [Acidimicrobiales bacterium]
MLEATVPLRRPLDLRLTLGPLRHGAADPSMFLGAAAVWRATRNAEGPAALHLRLDGPTLVVRAWGTGATTAIAGVSSLVGESDDDGKFRPRHRVVAELARRLVGLRVPCSGAVVELLVPTVLAQKVTAGEATRSYAALVRALGEPAPGPAGKRGLMVPPSPARLAATPSYAFHPLGVERRRAETIVRACRVAAGLEEAVGLTPAATRSRLTAVAGIGPWTAATAAGLHAPRFGPRQPIRFIAGI